METLEDLLRTSLENPNVTIRINKGRIYMETGAKSEQVMWAVPSAPRRGL